MDKDNKAQSGNQDKKPANQPATKPDPEAIRKALADKVDKRNNQTTIYK